MTTLSSRNLIEFLSEDQTPTPKDLYDCLAHSSTIIETSYGKVEYAINGEGPIILISHGGPGGYDQALMLGELFRKHGFKIIAPSRPGYLGTPLNHGKTAEEQGDFMAALLDALNIPSSIVIGVSGGGPASYQLAQRHPEKTKALVVIDGISMNYTKGDDINKVEEWMYLSNSGQWLMSFFFKHFPASVVKSFLRTESSLEKHELGNRVKEIVKDDRKFAMIDAMFKTMSDKFSERKAGAENDIALGAAIGKLPLDKISCPALIIHGDSDNDVLPRDAEYAHDAIPNSQLLWIEKASHIGFWTAADAYKVQKYTIDWLKKQ
ncbi:alpha/beta hydrolase [Maridesulfovibrio sp.]|uniref:alpha/beta fold hydrolase n=1 Tax=Maridesulfovibrio sp. TaxID=2795000 RepID=UPI0029C9D6C7|nr:alpha/beta hydrolase [Maridesulfovibrio sp.]